ncbi:MAG: GspE/PulE family protein [Candidatus Omnitrophota bacterium]|jgi:type IV pilus assembly protein PilB
MQTIRDRIIAILVADGHLSGEQIENALKLQKENGGLLRKILVDQGSISEEALLSLLSEKLYMPSIHLAKYKVDNLVAGFVPEQIARLYGIIPISRFGATIIVAVSDPLNIFVLDDLHPFAGYNVDAVLSTAEEIASAIEAQYGSGFQDMRHIFNGIFPENNSGKSDIELAKEDKVGLSSMLEESENSLIVKLIELILSRALKNRVSDIHIEPEYDCLRVRYRIDGSLCDAFRLPKTRQNAILTRVKVISSLDVAENRVPQDGRFKAKFEGKEVDFRVSVLPTAFGQKFVLRILDKENLPAGLDGLGFSEEPLRIFKEALVKPFGLILLTGPTGSGKSTTLYSVLNQLNAPEKNIITIEDPIEYPIEGISQIQVRSEIGLDFASGTRSLLKQNPDIVMIGEIRDSETADIAVKAALGGQLVFSTLHTNDSLSGIVRLINMGVEPFLVASGVTMLCTQRLARKICMKCRRPVEVSGDFLKKIGFSGEAIFYTASGCSYCNNTGFYGRAAIFEAVAVDDNMREMIIRKETLDKIKDYVRGKGVKTLRDDAFLKVKQELITLDEAIRITTEE